MKQDVLNMSSIIDMYNYYNHHKQQHIKMNNDIIRASNYKSFRALESDDFIVDGVQLDPFIVTTLNSMYKHPRIFNTPADNCIHDYRIYKYDLIKNVVRRYTRYTHYTK